MRKEAKQVLDEFKPVIEKYNSISKRKIADIFPQRKESTKKTNNIPIRSVKSR